MEYDHAVVFTQLCKVFVAQIPDSHFGCILAIGVGLFYRKRNVRRLRRQFQTRSSLPCRRQPVLSVEILHGILPFRWQQKGRVSAALKVSSYFALLSSFFSKNAFQNDIVQTLNERPSTCLHRFPLKGFRFLLETLGEVPSVLAVPAFYSTTDTFWRLPLPFPAFSVSLHPPASESRIGRRSAAQELHGVFPQKSR